LIRERDVARKRAESLQAEIDELLTRSTAGIAAEEELAAMRRQLEQAQRTAASLTTERDQLKQALAAATAELAGTVSFAANAEELTAVRRDLAAARAAEEKLTAELQAVQEEAKAALAAQARLRQEQSSTEIARAALEQNLATMTRDRDAAATLAMDFEARLKQIQGSLAAKDSEVERLRTEHQQILAAAESQKQKVASTIQANLAPQLEALKRERDQLSSQRDELAAELDATRERAKTYLRNQEKQVAAQIAALTEERDAARRESSAVAQRLAGMAVESDEKVAVLQRQLDVLAREKTALAKELDSITGNSNQQSGIFARELKTAAMQRDEAIAASESARELLKKQAAEFTRERADIERSVEERLARLERDVTRLRRDRDALLRQREELREKIGTVVEQQQKLVEDLTAQSGKLAPSPIDVVGRTRESREREPNVIDITEAEILHPGDPDTSGVRPPRVRPVMVPPPNLRVL
jgi:chromosome segregation ATPase